MRLGGDLSRGGGVAVRRLSAARLLWTRVVALLVFSVSFALPARWAGRRWVGGCVVGGVIGIILFGILLLLLKILNGSLLKSPVFIFFMLLFFILSFLMILLPNVFYLRRLTISFFLPGYRLAYLAFETISAMPLAILLISVFVPSQFLYGELAAGLLLVPATFLTYCGVRNLMSSFNLGLFFLFAMTSPINILLNVFSYANQPTSNLVQLKFYLIFSCIHVFVGGGVTCVSLTIQGSRFTFRGR
jgi:hypothetical protein